VALAGSRCVVDAAIMNIPMKVAAAAGLLFVAAALPLRSAHAAPQRHDGSHDFDWEVGVWNTHLRVLRQGADGTTAWVTYQGTSKVIPLWNCRGNMVELEVTGPDGRDFQAINLRLYDPASRQWSLNFANVATGVMGVPTIGEFHDGVGTFYDQEPIDGREVLVRNVWSNVTANSARFVQAISDDGGKTWQTNWIADDTRVKGTKNACAKG
jgi:hypothetical protein